MDFPACIFIISAVYQILESKKSYSKKITLSYGFMVSLSYHT